MKAPRRILPLVSEHPSGEETAVRIQQVLASRGLTLSAVSRESQLRYGENGAYRIPHHFYADMRTETFSPRMEQVLAFSTITNYRLMDWLAVFGFPLDDLVRIMASLPTERTILLDSEVYNDEAPIAWFRSKVIREPLPVIAPIGQFLEPLLPRPLKSVLSPKPSPFLYAKVGLQDAYAFPDLLPDSIVRIDTRFSHKELVSGTDSQHIFFVEHSHGFACCRVHVSGKNFITLRSTELPFAEVALRLGPEARVLGRLDLEFRLLASDRSPAVAQELAIFRTPHPLAPLSATQGFAEFVRRARDRAGLSLRGASVRSRFVAEAMHDARYFCGKGTLSAYEISGKPPRHIHKLLGLCVLYSVNFQDVLGTAVGKTQDLGRDPVPLALLGSQSSRAPNNRVQPGEFAGSFLSGIAQEIEEIPFFLRNSLSALTGIERLSLRDVVWLGGQRHSFHPYLRGALIAFVDRKQTKPPSSGKKRLWEEPLYVLLRRDGSYLCARCTLQDKLLVLPPFADGFERPVGLRKSVDAEVIGKVVALVRRL